MDDRTKVIASFVFLVVLVFGLWMFTDWFSKVTGYFGGESETESLITCLQNQGVEYYSIINCKDCEEQEKTIGQAIDKIKVSCGIEGESCKDIHGEFPVWYIGGEVKHGKFSLGELKEISGCE